MRRGRKRKSDPYQRLSKQVDEALRFQAELPYIFCDTLSWVEYARYIKSKNSVWFIESSEGVFDDDQ